MSGALFGLASGLAFGFSLNAFRHEGQAPEPAHSIYAAVVSVCVAQAMQSAGSARSSLRRPAVLRAVFAGARQSWSAGLCGSIAFSGWFIALALAPAASVRAVGVVEAPMAAFAGRRLFQEKLHLSQLVAGAAVAGGVVLRSLG